VSLDVELKPVTFSSRFGGLWTDLSNADEVLAGRLELGLITPEEAELLRFWIDNGYVVLDHAVSDEAIEKARLAIAEVYQAGRAIIETYEFGDVRYVKVEPRHRQMQHKLIDAYAHSDDIRKMMLSERIVRFLNIIFDRPALAFQSLYFEKGSQQDIHQDTAYVRVNRPMEMVGTWIAMEDIQEGSGELEYFVGSHRVPEFLWGEEKSKWMPYGSPDHPQFLAHLKSESERMGLQRVKFRPKKGDALVWHADLCHGGAEITNPTTRRSFVSHWCPVTAHPFYFGGPHHTGKIKVSDRAYYSFSYHGSPANPYQ
jgi:ectoine hydroxylase-related dioxygenase (phytanoyl-CoA dioxygenase family)